MKNQLHYNYKAPQLVQLEFIPAALVSAKGIFEKSNTNLETAGTKSSDFANYLISNCV